MPSPDTIAKIHAGLDRLRADQLAGTAPAPGDVSARTLAHYAGVSASTWSAYERLLKTKLLMGLLRNNEGIPVRLATHLRHQLHALLKESDQP